MSGPSKVNALRKLTEAAEALGWSVEEPDRADGPVLTRPATEQKRRTYVYIATHSDGVYFYTSEPGLTPVDLVALLLEVAR